MNECWDKIKHLFENDDGSLPDIYIEPVSDQELIKIYGWVSSVSNPPVDASAWSTIKQCDVLLSEIDNPAKRFVAGELELFRHALLGLKINGVEIPQLTVEISTNCVSFDYRMGPEWGSEQIAALCELLRKIKMIAPTARIFQSWEGSLITRQRANAGVPPDRSRISHENRACPFPCHHNHKSIMSECCSPAFFI